MILEREFVSVGVNRVANALDWGEDGQVAYGGHHMVAIYEPEVCHGWQWLGVLNGGPARRLPRLCMQRPRACTPCMHVSSAGGQD